MASLRTKKQKLTPQLEAEELRSLLIPAAANRGNLSPSKNSYVPTLQENAQEIVIRQKEREAQQAAPVHAARAAQSQDSAALRSPRHSPREQQQQVLAHISADVLESVKQDFQANDGALNLDQFARAMLRSLEPNLYAEKGRRRVGGVRFGEDDRPVLQESQSVRDFQKPAGSDGASNANASRKAAAVIDLFGRVDVHGEGFISWDDVSNYLIDQGMTGGDEFNVDSIKTYEPSPLSDQSRHDSHIEKLVYLEQIDSVVCFSQNSRSFRLYDPKRCSVKHEVSGHSGTVINCCYVEDFNQIATTAADMTICMWETTAMGLRNRIATKDVQLCVQYDRRSKSLFSGSIDGTLSRWDLSHMCLDEARRGQHKNAITDLLMVEDINLLASASADGSILMWDAVTLKPKKTFKGHRKGTYSLAYSDDYRCLLSAGLDQEACVWNPYVEKVPIFRLKGHTHALAGIAVVPGTPQILSADVAGGFRLWDMRNYRCIQSFGGMDKESSDVQTFCVMPSHRRLAAGGSKVLLYDYQDEGGDESVTDAAGITEALYNNHAGEFYTISKRNVKTWGASSGALSKVLRDVASCEITAACLADNGRKLYLGDSTGRVSAHSLHNGRVLRDFKRHALDISSISVWPGTNKIFTASWDGNLKVQSDEGTRRPQLKAEFFSHRDGITCMTCSPELMLLATGGMDMQVCFYDLKTLKLDHKISRFEHVISGLDLLASRCLLAAVDHGGNVSLWRVRPHGDKWMRVHYFRNMPTLPLPLELEEEAPKPLPIRLTGVCFAPAEPGESQPRLCTADAKGRLCLWDISGLCEKRGIVEADLGALFDRYYLAQLELARNGGMARVASSPELPRLAGSTMGSSGGAFLTGMDDDYENQGRTSSAFSLANWPGSVKAKPKKGDEKKEVQLLTEVNAHGDGAMSLRRAGQAGDITALVTCGADSRVATWDWKLESLGSLLQNKDENYRFPYNRQGAYQGKVSEAARLLERLGPWTPPARLPALSAAGSRSAVSLSLELDAGKKPKARKEKKEVQQGWEAGGGRFSGDTTALEEDFTNLFDQMELLGYTSFDKAEPPPSRLAREMSALNAGRIQQRSSTLSKDEADAADRLARAMSELGSDEFGTFSTMARAIRPRAASKGGPKREAEAPAEGAPAA